MLSSRLKNYYGQMTQKAAHLGQLSDIHSHKIGAILVHKKSIIGTGFNKKKSHPLQKRLNALREEGKRERSYLHAEIDCIGSLSDIPRGSTLFIGRFDLKGNVAMCRPCAACMACIRLRGVGELVYNTPEGFAIETIDL